MNQTTLETRDESHDIRQIRSAISRYLTERFETDQSFRPASASTQRWRISLENYAKLALALEAEDAVEHCLQNLIREIDKEAESGIWLEHPAANAAQLRRLSGNPALSANLHEELPCMLDTLFAGDETGAPKNVDRARASIESRYLHANVDAETSELVLMYQLQDEDEAADLTEILRATFYTFHENEVRRRCGLPGMLNESASQDLAGAVEYFRKRAGCYIERLAAIRRYSEIL